jgi:GR25 family glycosyltransferase involved in LPS biosynthesis
MRGEDRMKNIEKQMNILNKINENITMNYVDAVIGKDLDINSLINSNILRPDIYNTRVSTFNEKMENRKNEIGCYMSHLKAYSMIKDKMKNRINNSKYSIIFEDDFELSSDFVSTLEKTLITLENSIGESTIPDFDFLFLGLLGNNGENVIENVYYAPGDCFGTYGYLINNSHIDKIIDTMKYIDNIVDVQIFEKGIHNQLVVYRISPTIVEQGNFASTIRF